jgi:hypothetical protein
MAFAPSFTVDNATWLGRFNEADHGARFDYSRPEAGEVSPFPGYEVKVWCGPLGEFRWANVVKTRAYVVVDEGADGAPVVNKWIIRNHFRRDDR